MNSNTEYQVIVKSEDVAVVDETVNEAVAFESFDEIEDIVTASSKGTIVCCF